MNEFYSLMEEQRKLDGKVVALFERMHEDAKRLKATSPTAIHTLANLLAENCRGSSSCIINPCPFSKHCNDITPTDWECYALQFDKQNC